MNVQGYNTPNFRECVSQECQSFPYISPLEQLSPGRQADSQRGL